MRFLRPSCQFPALAAVSLAALMACSGSGGESAPSLGAAGGTVTIEAGPFAGTTIVIPPGALAGLRQIRVAAGNEFQLPEGLVPIGPSISLFDGLSLGLEAQARIPIEQTVLAGSRPQDVRVVDESGDVRPAQSVDLQNGGVWFDLESGGVFRPVILTSGRDGGRSVLPLEAELHLVMENGYEVEVVHSLVEPRLEGRSISLLRLDAGGPRQQELYFQRDALGATFYCGRFEFDRGLQFLAESPAEFLSPQTPSGTVSVVPVMSTVWTGPLTPTMLGSITEDFEVSLIQVGSVPTAAGTFDDCVELTIRDIGSLAGAFDELTLTIARGIGPVRIERPFSGVDVRFVSGTRDGLPITPSRP